MVENESEVKLLVECIFWNEIERNYVSFKTQEKRVHVIKSELAITCSSLKRVNMNAWFAI